jgi:ABC-2 type transport system ATP-binding protein
VALAGVRIYYWCVPADFAIELNHVSKIYRGRVHALQDISLSVRRGEVFGLLGPNGAGKSTLIKIMMTVVGATRAVGTILGQPVGHKPTLARVGYLPEHHRFPRYLTGRQTLEFFAALSGVDRVTRGSCWRSSGCRHGRISASAFFPRG